MVKHLQILFNENFQCVLVLEDDFDVHAEKVIAVRVLPAEIAVCRSRQTKEMLLENCKKKKLQKKS